MANREDWRSILKPKKFSTLALNSHQKLAISKLIEGRKVFSLLRAPSRVNSNPQDWSEHLNVSL